MPPLSLLAISTKHSSALSILVFALLSSPSYALVFASYGTADGNLFDASIDVFQNDSTIANTALVSTTNMIANGLNLSRDFANVGGSGPLLPSGSNLGSAQGSTWYWHDSRNLGTAGNFHESTFSQDYFEFSLTVLAPTGIELTEFRANHYLFNHRGDAESELFYSLDGGITFLSLGEQINVDDPLNSNPGIASTISFSNLASLGVLNAGQNITFRYAQGGQRGSGRRNYYQGFQLMGNAVAPNSSAPEASSLLLTLLAGLAFAGRRQRKA